MGSDENIHCAPFSTHPNSENSQDRWKQRHWISDTTAPNVLFLYLLSNRCQYSARPKITQDKPGKGKGSSEVRAVVNLAPCRGKALSVVRTVFPSPGKRSDATTPWPSTRKRQKAIIFTQTQHGNSRRGIWVLALPEQAVRCRSLQTIQWMSYGAGKMLSG